MTAVEICDGLREGGPVVANAGSSLRDGDESSRCWLARRGVLTHPSQGEASTCAAGRSSNACRNPGAGYAALFFPEPKFVDQRRNFGAVVKKVFVEIVAFDERRVIELVLLRDFNIGWRLHCIGERVDQFLANRWR